MIRAFTFSAWLLVAAAASGCAEDAAEPSIDVRSCSVDLERGSTDCDLEGIRVDLGRAAGSASLASGTCFQSRVDVDLAPGGQRVRFGITYGPSVWGWTVNIGDSPTNNGFAGDGGTQSRDAELQIVDTQMIVYGNDYTVGRRDLATLDGLSLASRTIDLVASNLRLDWSRLSPYGSGHVSSPYLFALAGQDDAEGTENYTIHAAFNRVIDDNWASERSGCGVTSFQVTVETIGPFEVSEETEE